MPLHTITHTYSCTHTHTESHTRLAGNCSNIIMTFIMSGTYNAAAHTHRNWEISQVSSSAIINLNNASVTFIIADTNAALHRRPGVHQRSCAIQPSMGRDRERGGRIFKKKKEIWCFYTTTTTRDCSREENYSAAHKKKFLLN